MTTNYTLLGNGGHRAISQPYAAGNRYSNVGLGRCTMFGSDGAKHSDQLKTTERYTRSQDGKTLLLTATFEDPLSLREPVVLKKIWSWAPGSEIAPYKDCQRPDEFSKSGKRP